MYGDGRRQLLHGVFQSLHDLGLGAAGVALGQLVQQALDFGGAVLAGGAQRGRPRRGRTLGDALNEVGQHGDFRPALLPGVAGELRGAGAGLGIGIALGLGLSLGIVRCAASCFTGRPWIAPIAQGRVQGVHQGLRWSNGAGFGRGLGLASQSLGEGGQGLEL